MSAATSRHRPVNADNRPMATATILQPPIIAKRFVGLPLGVAGERFSVQSDAQRHN